MALPLLKSIHYISLYMFLGAPVFWYLMWRPAVGNAMPTDGQIVYKRMRTGLVAGFVLFVLSGFAHGIVAASPFGYVVLKLILAAGAALSWHLAEQRASRLFGIGGWAMGIGLLVIMGLLSDTATNPGIFPVASDVVHLLASILWVGGLLFLATVPWKSIGSRGTGSATPLSTLIERFSTAVFVAIVLVAGTGAFASYLHVYTPLALQKTSYGRTLVVKIALFLVVLLIATINFLVVSPALRRAGRRGEASQFRRNVARFAVLVRIKAVVLVTLLVVVGMLTSLSPADTVAELMHGVWHLEMDGHFLTAEMSPGGEPGALQIDLYLTDAERRPVPEQTRVTVDMEMPEHSMGIGPIEAELISPGHYRANPVVSMAGDWDVIIGAALPDRQIGTAFFDIEALQGSRSVGQTRRFDLRAVFFELREAQAERAFHGEPFVLREFVQDFVFSTDGRPLNFVAGMLWLVGAIYIVITSLRRILPRWAAPVGMIALGIGGYLLFSATLVDAYPTAFVRNPVPFTSDSVNTGRELYVMHCSVCHGPQGHGDGELAPYLEPPPEDLRVRHVDAHPDGEMFWWISHGIPGTDMPATEGLMSEEQRWHVVNFVRSLHREVPDDDGAP